MDATTIRILAAIVAIALGVLIFLRRRSHKEE
jgi:hypothetical protein